MREIKLNVLWKCAFVLLLIFSSFSILATSQDIMASEEFSIETVVTYSKEQNTTSIVFDMESLDNAYTITDITAPNETKLDLMKPVFDVEETGKYAFKVAYIKGDTKESKVFTKTVDVQSIQRRKGAGEKIAVAPKVPLLRSVVSDGGVSVFVKNTDGSDWDVLQGWNNGEIKDIAVTVKFNDDINDNKNISITLPEGLMFNALSIKEGTDVSGITGANFTSLYGTGDMTGDSIREMSIPSTEVTGATFGTVNYSVYSGINEITIRFKASMDTRRYYAPHTLQNPLEALATKGASSEMVGHVSQAIVAVGAPTKEPNLWTVASNGGGVALPGGEFVGKGFKPMYPDSSPRILGAKAITIKYHYVPNMGFQGIRSSGWTELERDLVEHSITYEKTNDFPTLVTGNTSFDFTYKIPDDALPGAYTANELTTVTYTWYDGATTTVSQTGDVQKESIVVKASMVDKMQAISGGDLKMDGSIPDAKSIGPSVRIGNKQPGVVKNQVFEALIDTNFKVSRINIPFEGAEGSTITNIEFKTNKRDWTSSSAKPVSMTSALHYVTRFMLGITDATEFITGFRANVGSFTNGYMSSAFPNEAARIATYGAIEEGTGSANVTYSMYCEDDKENTLVSRVQTVSETGPSEAERTMGSESSSSFLNVSGQTIASILAGDTYQVTAIIRPSYYYAQMASVQAVKNPDIYIREPKGQSLVLDSIKLLDQSGKKVTWGYEEPTTNSYGDKIYKITTSDVTVGTYFTDGMQSKYISITYSMATSVQAQGAYSANALIGWGKPGTTSIKLGAQATPITTDIYDLNGNGEVDDQVLGIINPKTLVIAENKNVLVESFLSIAGDRKPKPPYVEGNADSIAYFTPGTDADYNVKITNNAETASDSFSAYLPIPKTGKSFGSGFQSEAFKWDMTLSRGAELDPSLIGKYEVLYSSDATADNYDTSATYTNVAPTIKEDLAKVTMIKIHALQPLQPKAVIEVGVPLKVDEDFDSAVAGNKIGTMDVYNPRYVAKGEGFDVKLPGTKVGAQLVIAEIEGLAFMDKDADGLYTEGTDTIVKDQVVELYQWDEISSMYKAVLDEDTNQPISTKTGTEGTYLFDYSKGMNYGNYAVRFVEIAGGDYQYTINVPNKTNNSSAIIKDGLPNPGDSYKGWVLNIDPTKPTTKNVNVGFLAYKPPVDLTVSLPTTPQKVKVGESLSIMPLFMESTPELWNTIKATTNPVKYEIVGTAPAGVTMPALTANADGSVSIAPTALASGTASFQVKATIYDQYGNEAESNTIMVSVVSNTPPTITTNTLTVYVGDTVDLLSGVSAVDNTGTAIMPIWTGINGNASVTNNTPNVAGKYTTAGTYEEMYTFKDDSGNEATKNRLVKVNEVPVVQAYGQVYTLGETNIMTSVEASASASWMKAPATVGAAVAQDISASITKNISGPSTDFSKVGIYEVVYTVNNGEGKESSKTVKVLVQPKGAVSDDGYIIDANSFVLENAEAKSINEMQALNKGIVSAYKIYRDEDGQITNITEVSTEISANEVQLNAIKGALNAGGIYSLTYQVGEAKKTVNVFVKPKDGLVSNDGTLILDANNFQIDYANALLLDAAQAKLHTKISAIEIVVDADGYMQFNDVKSDVTVDAIELDEIHEVDKKGGIFSLTFYVTGATDSLEKQIEVFVHPLGAIGDPTNSLLLGGQGFTLTLEEARALSDTIAKDLGNVSAYRIEKDSEGNEIGFQDLSNGVQANAADLQKIKEVGEAGGILSLTFSIVDGGITVNKKIMVVVIGTGTPPVIITPEEDYLAIHSNDVTLSYNEAIKATKESIIKVTNTRAYLIKSGVEVQVDFSAEDLAKIKQTATEGGTHEVVMSANSKNPKAKADGVRLQTKIKITVLKEQTNPNYGNPSQGDINTSDTTNISILVMLLITSMGILILKKRID